MTMKNNKNSRHQADNGGSHYSAIDKQEYTSLHVVKPQRLAIVILPINNTSNKPILVWGA